MRNVLWLVVFLAVCLVSGCGAARNKVPGKIVKGGQPFTLSDKGVFVLSFVPEGGGSGVFNATTKPDGTFTIVGPEGKGVPAGKYTVNLTAMDPYPTTDLLKGKYKQGSKEPPMVVDIGSGEVVIDVGK